MKQEQFRNVYQHIHLSSQQKDRIWNQIQTASNPEPASRAGDGLLHYPTRAAVCLGALLLSGMTVFAANELSLIDRLAEAMKTLTQNEKDVTQDQENLYAQYGQVLENEIELKNGTIYLDAALYDQNHIIIPFRYVFHSDVKGYETLTAGADLEQESLRRTQIIYRQDTNTFLWQVSFRIVKGSTGQANSQYLITNPILSEDGTISGSLLICSDEPKPFEPGTVIQLVKTADASALEQTAKSADVDSLIQAAESVNANENPTIYTEFTLGKALEQYALTIDAENAAALKDIGISIENISLSPLSLCYSGKGTHTRALSASITVVLKDGRVIEKSPNGSGYALSDTNRDNTSFSFYARVFFTEPVLPEDIAEIHIQDNRGTDIHIPVEDHRPDT